MGMQNGLKLEIWPERIMGHALKNQGYGPNFMSNSDSDATNIGINTLMAVL